MTEGESGLSIFEDRHKPADLTKRASALRALVNEIICIGDGNKIERNSLTSKDGVYNSTDKHWAKERLVRLGILTTGSTVKTGGAESSGQALEACFRIEADAWSKDLNRLPDENRAKVKRLFNINAEPSKENEIEPLDKSNKAFTIAKQMVKKPRSKKFKTLLHLLTAIEKLKNGERLTPNNELTHSGYDHNTLACSYVKLMEYGLIKEVEGEVTENKYYASTGECCSVTAILQAFYHYEEDRLIEAKRAFLNFHS